MSQVQRNKKVKDLLDSRIFTEKEVTKMSDEQIVYFHWLYFEESVYEYM